MNLVASGFSATGRRRQTDRSVNEDAVLVLEDRGIFAAVDGVSTHPRGDAAAKAVVDVVGGIVDPSPNATRLAQAFRDVEAELERLRTAALLPKTPKAVATAIWVREDPDGTHRGWMAHIGDTTAFLVDHTTESIVTLTTPHTEWNGRYHVVRRCLGLGRPEPDMGHVVLPPNHTLLVVTDGITKKLNTSEICTKVLHMLSPQELVMSLVRMAITANESDDISVVAVRTLRP